MNETSRAADAIEQMRADTRQTVNWRRHCRTTLASGGTIASYHSDGSMTVRWRAGEASFFPRLPADTEQRAAR